MKLFFKKILIFVFPLFLLVLGMDFYLRNMNSLYDDKPIIACSTGTLSNTAIGLIRLSGFPNLNYLQEFFSFNFFKIKKRYAHMSNIIDGDKTLDNIVLTYFEGPNSYNGENILELSVHGNQINIQNILNRFIILIN